MANHIKERADFEKIRYANCWEDASILCTALQPAPGKRYLSIASAGDNSFSLLAAGAEVVAADLSPAQLACVELRRESFRQLSHSHLLAFFGITESENRIHVYQEIKSGLSENAANFWDNHSAEIENGFIHAGKFENYFKTFRTRIVPLVHSRQKIAQLLADKTIDQQSEFYRTKWDTFRWRMLFRFFFSRFVMARLGRDPEFFRYVEGSVSEKILSRTKHALTCVSTNSNPYLRYILTGNYSVTEALPHYLREENFEAIRAGLNRLTLFHGSIQDAAIVHQQTGFDGYNLSDIFEYLDEGLCEKIYGQLIESARPGARWAYWNMLVPRERPEVFATQIRQHTALGEELLDADMAWFYSAFKVEEKA